MLRRCGPRASSVLARGAPKASLDPAKYGLTAEEVREKAAAATRPYKFKSGATNRTFSVTSSTQATAKLSQALKQAAQGVDGEAAAVLASPVDEQKRLRAVKKEQEARKKWQLRVAGGIGALVLTGGIAVCFVLPSYGHHQRRQQMHQRRYEEVFLPSMERLLREHDAQLAAGAPPATRPADPYGEAKPPPRRKPSVFD